MQTNGASETGGERPRRTRKGRKRTAFRKAPSPAWPVRGLWESAPQEERTRAHETCMKILEYWLGKKTKSEIAKDLEVTPLRVWQLSQQALSGMMAGLLTQPRRRVGPEAFSRSAPGESPAELKRRIVRLESELARTEDLVRVLRTAPWCNPSPESPPKGGKARGRAKKARTQAKRPDRGATPGRENPPGEGAHEAGASGDC